MNKILYGLVLLSITQLFATNSSTQEHGMYYVTVSDTEHFPWLQGLIKSILKYNYKNVSEIAVFDLGLMQDEIDTLNQMAFVKVYDIDDTNSDMRKKFTVRTCGRLARGWYSWKPVVFYQSLKMFPYFLYLDSGIEVVAPLDDVFDEIRQNGYYLFDCPHLIFPVITNHVKKLFNLNTSENEWILEENCVSGGLQGISRDMLDSYVMPIYQLTFDIKNFEDDGTAFWGYGFARHDQTIFSVFARKLGLKTHVLYPKPRNIRVGNKKFYFGALKHFKLRKHAEKDKERLEHARQHNLLG